MLTQADLSAMSREQLIDLSRRIDWYHVLDLGDGVLTDGAFDLRPHLPKYGFPENLSGKSVLDVGRASGFLSFELERRGARVTATELPDPFGKDFVGGDLTRAVLEERECVDPRAGRDVGRRLDFFVARTLLRSSVTPLFVDIRNLSPSATGGRRFDWVVVGSLLNHLRDPVGALCNVLSVCEETCVVVNPIDREDTSSIPRMRLVGTRAPSLTTWWLPNVRCLVEMMECAGFDPIRVVSDDLVLTTRHQGASIPHAVIHGGVPPEKTRKAKLEEILARWKPEVSNSSRLSK